MSMINLILQIWFCSALIIVTTHLFSALVIDGHIDLGIWGKGALIIFSLIGPLGVLLEAILILYVLVDIKKQSPSKQAQTIKEEITPLHWTETYIQKRKVMGQS